MGSSTNRLSAEALKIALWDTLSELREGEISAITAFAVSSQARQILCAGRLQLRVSEQSKRPVPAELIAFSEESDVDAEIGEDGPDE